MKYLQDLSELWLHNLIKKGKIVTFPFHSAAYMNNHEFPIKPGMTACFYRCKFKITKAGKHD
ncbi:MAG: hypothetical protein C4581_13280 [Nitrospiraceae bacterium]|nr:MAG: hypothetical protein C4581_13280 [Nitrospiraceae bacterium]